MMNARAIHAPPSRSARLLDIAQTILAIQDQHDLLVGLVSNTFERENPWAAPGHRDARPYTSLDKDSSDPNEETNLFFTTLFIDAMDIGPPYPMHQPPG
jgi:hypothetical protein